MDTSTPPLNMATMPMCLEDVTIKQLPERVFYISNFISEDEEQMLLSKIQTAPKPRWKQLSKRRIQVWPSDLAKNNTLLEAPLPKWLTEPIVSRLLSCPISASDVSQHIFSNSPHGMPNHVLINEYLPGQGIMPHKDGSSYHPLVCTVSLGAPLCLQIYGTKEDGTTESEPRWRIFQEPRSLLITTDKLYTDYLHGIAEITEDADLGPDTVANWSLLGAPDKITDRRSERQPRTSLTYRDVIKVSKLGVKLGIFGKR